MSEIEKQVPSGKFEEQKTITSILFSKDYNVNVGEKSFKGCTSLEKINIDNKIKTIGQNAFFNCKKLYGDNDKCDDSSCKGCDKCKVLNLSNCEYIGYGAFANCENISNIIFCEEDNVNVEIGESEDSYSEYEDSYSNLEIYGAFENCKLLKNINENNRIEKIGTKTFSNCVNLSNINISNCTEIGDSAFEKCENLSNINLSNCKKIHSYAFNGCKSLLQITLDVCDELDISAFNGCEKLTKVYMYTKNFCTLNNDKGIDHKKYDINYNFYVTYESIVNYKSDKLYWEYYIGKGKVLVVAGDNNYIYKTEKDKKINLPSNYNNDFDDYFKFGSISFNYIIKNVNAIFKGNEELTYIDMPSKSIRIIESAFENCTKLKEIILPNTLKIIEDYAFKNCTSLSLSENPESPAPPIILPESIEELEEGIFAGCENISKFEGKFVTYDGKAIVYNNKLINVALKDINETIKISDIDENIKRLGKYCFSGCENITTVHIPDNILSIGNYAFENCKNLKDIYIYGNPPILGLDVFEKISEDFKIYVDEDKVELYKLVYENDGYAGRIEKREL